MSDLMLQGVLNMPLPGDPSKMGVVEWVQFRERAKQAAARISALEAALVKADELAGSVQGLNGSLWQTTIPNALTAYRQARDATK